MFLAKHRPSLPNKYAILKDFLLTVIQITNIDLGMSQVLEIEDIVPKLQ